MSIPRPFSLTMTQVSVAQQRLPNIDFHFRPKKTQTLQQKHISKSILLDTLKKNRKKDEETKGKSFLSPHLRGSRGHRRNQKMSTSSIDPLSKSTRPQDRKRLTASMTSLGDFEDQNQKTAGPSSSINGLSLLEKMVAKCKEAVKVIGARPDWHVIGIMKKTARKLRPDNASRASPSLDLSKLTNKGYPPIKDLSGAVILLFFVPILYNYS